MNYRPDPLDSKFSFAVRCRDQWTCQLCGRVFVEGSQDLHNSHFQGRRKKATRFDPQNCYAICGIAAQGAYRTCHEKLEHNPELHRAFMVNRIGEQEVAELILRANSRDSKIPTRDEVQEIINAIHGKTQSVFQ